MRACRYTVAALLVASPVCVAAQHLNAQDFAAAAAARACQQESRPYNGRVLSGVVRHRETGDRVPDAHLIMTWPVATVDGIVEEQERAITDSSGFYKFCSVPPVDRLIVRAVRESLVSEFVTIELHQQSAVAQAFGAWRQNLELAPAELRIVSMTGAVTDAATALPVFGATVSLWGTELEAQTDSAGEFRLDNVWAGRHRVVVRRIGYRLGMFDFSIPSGADAHLPAGQLALRTLPEQLQPVVVEAEAGGKLDGFYRRRRQGFGEFLTREEFEKFNPTNTSDVLRRLPNLRVTPNPNYGRGGDLRPNLVELRRALVRGGAFGGGECPAVFFIDGVFQGNTRDNEIDLSVFWDEIEAVETFAGAQVPAGFNAPGSDCGVVAIWTQ